MEELKIKKLNGHVQNTFDHQNLNIVANVLNCEKTHILFKKDKHIQISERAEHVYICKPCSSDLLTFPFHRHLGG